MIVSVFDTVRRVSRGMVHGRLALAVTLMLAGMLAGAMPSAAQARAFDRQAWLDDLAQARTAFATKYANLEWAEFDSAHPPSVLFAQTRARLETATSDADARAAFDRLVRHLGDGHVEFDWSRSGPSLTAGAPPADLCADYDRSRAGAPLAAAADGYQPLETPQSPVFPAGVIPLGNHRVGVIKIGMFGPHASPVLCRAAIASLAIHADQPCEEDCADRIDQWASDKMTEDFIAQIEALKRGNIDTLLVDIAGNGGGSEWSEAAVRIVTPIRIKSSMQAFVRGQHWTKKFTTLEQHLLEAEKNAGPEDRALLRQLLADVVAKKAVSEMPCPSDPIWEGKRPACSWLGGGIYATGLLDSADPATIRGKPWAAEIFTPSEFPYVEGVWRGPLIVLVDRNSASASEEFAAELQDNKAAIIMGEPTFGAGCGHTDGGTPTRLNNSGAVLRLPDCVRFRADGSNEVRGVLPDVLVGFRRSDGPRLRAVDFLAKLPEALARTGHDDQNHDDQNRER